MLKGKKILLAVTGGIAAYKAVTLCSMLKKGGAAVKVMMTESAQKFITPLPFSTLTRQEVITTIWKDNGDIPHIDAADWADLIVIAPATGNIIAKIANGIADDVVSSTLLAKTSPVLIVPAMNVNMLNNPATQQNIKTLQQRGYDFMESEYGNLACGYEAKGRYPENEEIIYHIISNLYYGKDLQGKSILVTAGASKEHIDPMRFISNMSTGKMGLALARAAHIRGAEVTLIAGAIKEQPPQYLKTISAHSAEEMFTECTSIAPCQNIIIMNAAVSDYTPANPTQKKIKKGADLMLELKRTKDIISQLAQNKQEGQIICGFAAESENVTGYAKEKMIRKGLDCIVANNLHTAGKQDTEAWFINNNKETRFTGSKFSVAHNILTELVEMSDND